MLKACINARARLAELRRDLSGAALLEYSLLVGLIVVAAAGAVIAVQGKVIANWIDMAAWMPG